MMTTEGIKATLSVKDLAQMRGVEVMSPEGVEEKLEYNISFAITLTQGGKYRLYGVQTQCGSPKCKVRHDPISLGIEDTREAMIAILGSVFIKEGITMAAAKMFTGSLDDFFKQLGGGE